MIQVKSNGVLPAPDDLKCMMGETPRGTTPHTQDEFLVGLSKHQWGNF